MRKLILIASLFALSGGAYADIQAPPGAQYNSTRKLGRALANIFYGAVEIPEQFFRRASQGGRKAGGSYGIVAGGQRTLKRMGYGCYELLTFYCPTYNGTFKPPYKKCGADWRVEMNPHDGLSEFPPELGFETAFSHARRQSR
jgi:putative exosortase-associated protein (TIGR04073 family)